MQEFQLDLQVITVPPVAQRGRHTLIVLKNKQGNYLLGSKRHYPVGVARLIGGGLEGTEEPQIGATRELLEETGLKAEPTELKPLAQITAELIDQDHQHFTFTTFLYFYQTNDQAITPNDDIDALVELTPSQFSELLEKFQHLSAEIHPIKNFTWQDWGKIYGEIHKIAFDLTEKL